VLAIAVTVDLSTDFLTFSDRRRCCIGMTMKLASLDCLRFVSSGRGSQGPRRSRRFKRNPQLLFGLFYGVGGHVVVSCVRGGDCFDGRLVGIVGVLVFGK
jgi:hypothetical protein